MKLYTLFFFAFCVLLISFQMIATESDGEDDYSTVGERAANRQENRVGRRHNRVNRRHSIWDGIKEWFTTGYQRRQSRRLDRKLRRQDRRVRRQDRRQGRYENRQERRESW